MKGEKLHFVDSIRGIAVLLVILVHASQYVTGLPPIANKLLAQGSRGVLLFYIASAFTLFLSLNNRKEENYLSYFIRRFFRIAPLYFLAILVYLVANGLGPRYWLGDQIEVTVANIISHFFFLNGVNPYWINSIIGVEWSVAVEMMFYLFVPLLFSKIKSLQQAMVFLGVAVGFSFGMNLVFSNAELITDERLWADYLTIWFPHQLPIFALGITFFFLWKEGSIKNSILQLFSNKKIMKVCLLMLCFSMVLIEKNITFIFGVIFLFYSYYLFTKQPKVFVNNILGYVGKISYSVYLTHFLILKLTNSLFAGSLDGWPILKLIMIVSTSLLLTVCISAITYRCIELPGMGLGRAVIKRIQMTKNKKSDNTITT